MKEIRQAAKYEIRELKEENEVVIEGYIAKFDTETELWEGFYEKIDKGAFDDTLRNDNNKFLLYHHDWSKPLASTKAGTLELSTDDIGLRFKAKISSVLSYAKDTVELIRQGLIQGCSFGFSVISEDGSYDSETDIFIRSLKKIELYEGSVLCIPQYEDTEVYTRAKEVESDLRKKLKEEKDLEQLKKDYELIKIENELL